MTILDTHAWIWWVTNPSKLSATARAHLERADEIGVLVISCWEVAMLVAKDRLRLDRDVLVWVRQALAGERISLLPLSPSAAVVAGSLGDDFHGDPADRLIVATAQELKAPLVTKDRDIRSFRGVETLW